MAFSKVHGNRLMTNITEQVERELEQETKIAMVSLSKETMFRLVESIL